MNLPFNPYSNNIVFFDTEFSSLDPHKGEILSLGMVSLEGKELYFELEHGREVDPWVKENILPTLKESKVSCQEAVERICEFLGKDCPYLVSYVNQYDIIYLYKLFSGPKGPFYWLPIDFAAILFGLGIDPEILCLEDKEKFFKTFGIDVSGYRQHHALDDARLLREAYLRLLL